MTTDLEGRTALVTGAASGIGRATAELLAARGANVVVADIRAELAEEVAAGIDEAGGTARGVAADVTDPDQVEAMVAGAVEAFGALHIAVNNAGASGHVAPTAEHPLEAWNHIIALNLTGVFLCLRAEIPRMLDAGGGSIVNMSSGAGLMGFPGLPAYVASKHGVIGLTRGAALEYARKGVRINAVCPGTVRTPMLEEFTHHDEAALQGMGKMMPVGRLATPDEIAEAVLWLCSPASSYVTGHAMAVDGGASVA